MEEALRAKIEAGRTTGCLLHQFPSAQVSEYRYQQSCACSIAVRTHFIPTLMSMLAIVCTVGSFENFPLSRRACRPFALKTCPFSSCSWVMLNVQRSTAPASLRGDFGDRSCTRPLFVVKGSVNALSRIRSYAHGRV